MTHSAFIGIGSNLGDKLRNCASAITQIGASEESRVLRRSSFYRTEPVGFRDQDWFVNCVIEVETTLEPLALLVSLKHLETKLGRRVTFPGGPRVIDLDLLLFDSETIQNDDLEVPHPRLHERAFVLVPLCEIDPEVVHPWLKRTARWLLEALGEITGVERI